MARNCRMHLQVAAAGAAQLGQVQDAFGKDAQKGIVGFRPRAVELVVDQRVPVLAGGRQPVFQPERLHLLLGFDHRMDVVVNDLVLAVAAVLAHQVRTAEIIVPVDQRHGPAQLRRHMKRHRRLAGAGGAGEMDRIARLQIGQRPAGDLLHKRRRHKPVAGFGQKSVGVLHIGFLSRGRFASDAAHPVFAEIPLRQHRRGGPGNGGRVLVLPFLLFRFARQVVRRSLRLERRFRRRRPWPPHRGALPRPVGALDVVPEFLLHPRHPLPPLAHSLFDPEDKLVPFGLGLSGHLPSRLGEAGEHPADRGLHLPAGFREVIHQGRADVPAGADLAAQPRHVLG